MPGSSDTILLNFGSIFLDNRLIVKGMDLLLKINDNYTPIFFFLCYFCLLSLCIA